MAVVRVTVDGLRRKSGGRNASYGNFMRLKSVDEQGDGPRRLRKIQMQGPMLLSTKTLLGKSHGGISRTRIG